MKVKLGFFFIYFVLHRICDEWFKRDDDFMSLMILEASKITPLTKNSMREMAALISLLVERSSTIQD